MPWWAYQYLQCDRCPVTFECKPREMRAQATMEAAREAGWLISGFPQTPPEHLCPACRALKEK